jgi:cytochrome oxidase assembly protein ShyY1
MSRPSSFAIRSSQRAPVQRPDRLSLAVAGPIVLALSVLCWLAVWQVARLVF